MLEKYMKIEIEKVHNGYVVVLPKDEYNEVAVRRKFVVQDEVNDSKDESVIAFQTFSELVNTLQEVFEVYNSKHNIIGYINGLCSEEKRWDIGEVMKESLKNPKNDLGDN
jgi:hypothetical protein